MSIRQEALDQQEKKRAAQPKFVLASGGGSMGPAGAHYTIKLSNTGAVATNVEITADGREEPKHISVVDKSERTFDLKFNVIPQHPIRLSITYNDADSTPGQIDFLGKPKAGGLRFDQQVVPLGRLAP